MRYALFVVFAAVCFGTTGTAQAFAPEGASPASIGAVRILIGGAVLALVAVAEWRWRRPATPDDPSPAGHPHRRWTTVLLVLLGAAGVLAYQPAFFAGTAANGVAVGTIVALGSAPVITGLLDWLLTRRFPGLVWVVATLVATAGLALLTGIGGSGPVSLPGILASLGAGASYAVYTLASKELLTRGWSPLATMGALFGVAALGSVPVLCSTDASWLASGAGLAVALWLGLVTTALAYVLFAIGLRHLRAATTSTLTLAEPLTATLLGVLVLGERLGASAVLGLLVVAAGLAILVIPWRGRAGSALPH